MLTARGGRVRTRLYGEVTGYTADSAAAEQCSPANMRLLPPRLTAMKFVSPAQYSRSNQVNIIASYLCTTTNCRRTT